MKKMFNIIIIKEFKLLEPNGPEGVSHESRLVQLEHLNFRTVNDIKLSSASFLLLSQTHIVIKSISFQLVIYSSSWHVSFGIFTAIFSKFLRITPLTIVSK